MRKILVSIFSALIITIILYSVMLVATTFNDSEEEISCVHGTAGQGTSGSGFSNGIWRGDNPWNIFVGNAKGDTAYLNCDCGIFGDVEFKFGERKQPVCVYYNKGYINNKEECVEKSTEEYEKEYVDFGNTGGKTEGVCICLDVSDPERGDVCLPRDTWEWWQEDRAKGFMSQNEIGGILKPHFIFFGIMYILILILTSIAVMLRSKKQ